MTKINFAIAIIFIFCLSSLNANSQSQNLNPSSKANTQNKNYKNNSSKKPHTKTKNSANATRAKSHKKNYVQRPTLKPDENTVFFEHEYRIFKTRTVDGVDYSLNCFKNNTPNCKAFNAVKEDSRWNTSDETYESNLAAKLCRQHQGRALIAFNAKNEEYDVCRFTDGSLYSSWQVYYKLNRQTLTQ